MSKIIKMKGNKRLANQFKEKITRSALGLKGYRRVLANFREQLAILQKLLHARFAKHTDLIKLIININNQIPFRFIRLRLTPTHLRISAPRIGVFQSLGGRAPPPVAIFAPIPHKTEMGSCARSDLTVSAY